MSGQARRRRGAPRRGFTIVDLLIAIVIIGILVTIAYPYVRRMRGGGAAGASAARLSWVARPDSTVAPGDSAEVAVRVEDAEGRPVPGAVVEFQTATGTVQPANGTSDASGLVPATWRFGTDPGRVVLTARVRGQPVLTGEVTALVRGAP
jgi:prepilin-type N-terminal cleavage/methylation domain-containing protein